MASRGVSRSGGKTENVGGAREGKNSCLGRGTGGEQRRRRRDGEIAPAIFLAGFFTAGGFFAAIRARRAGARTKGEKAQRSAEIKEKPRCGKQDRRNTSSTFPIAARWSLGGRKTTVAFLICNALSRCHCQ